MSRVIDEAKKLLETMSPDADWEEIMYHLYARQKIEEGLEDAEAGRVISQEEVEARFLGGR